MIDIIRESVVDDWQWALLAFVGNAVFFMRFVVQWLASERRGKSYLPLSFWLFSLAGSGLLIIYAVHIRNFMIILPLSLAVPIYLRNIHLQRREYYKTICGESSVGRRK